MAEAAERKILSGATIFIVADVVKAAEYYRDKLGFRFERYWGDPPTFCMLWRNEQCVMLSKVEDTGLIRPVSSVRPDIWDAYFWVNDVEGFFEELTGNGASTISEPTVTFYNVKEFTVRDPDGYVICFGEGMNDG